MRYLVFVLGLFLFAAAGGADPYDDLRYNDVRQKASHNSYQRDEGIISQLDYHRIHTIEFDLRLKRPFFLGGKGAPVGDWLTYHSPFEYFDTSCRTMSDCLALVGAYHRAVPEHEVVTVFFDVDIDDGGHGLAAFEDAVKSMLPEDALFTPPDLMAACEEAETLQESVTLAGCGWPFLSDLRGKIVPVVSGGRKDFIEQGYDPAESPVFIISSLSSGGIEDYPDVVFFNMAGPNEKARTVREAGFVTRLYYLNDPTGYEKAKELGAHILATDMANYIEYPWAVTHNDRGFPFQPLEEDVRAGLPTDDDALGVRASGQCPLVTGWGEGAITMMVTGPGSQVDPDAAGCVFVRGGGKSFSLCKPADKRPVYAKWDGGMSSAGRREFKGYSPESVSFLRLSADQDGCVVGEASVDLAEWNEIGRACLGAAVEEAGIMVKAGNEEVKFRFRPLTTGLDLDDLSPEEDADCNAMEFRAGYLP